MKKMHLVNVIIVSLVLVAMAGCATTGAYAPVSTIPGAPAPIIVERPVVMAPAPIVLPPVSIGYNQFGHGRSVSVSVGNSGYGCVPVIGDYDSSFQRQMMVDQMNFENQRWLDNQNFENQRRLDNQNFAHQLILDNRNRSYQAPAYRAPRPPMMGRGSYNVRHTR